MRSFFLLCCVIFIISVGALVHSEVNKLFQLESKVAVLNEQVNAMMLGEELDREMAETKVTDVTLPRKKRNPDLKEKL